MAYKVEEFPWSSNYNSDLREVLALLNKVMVEYDELYAKLLAFEAEKEIIKADIVKLQKDFAKLLVDFDNFKKAAEAEIAAAIARMEAEIANQYAQLLNRITTLFDSFRNEFNDKIKESEIRTDIKISTVDMAWRKAISEIWEYIDSIKPVDMINPLSKEKQKIPVVVTDLYEKASREHALYNFEYKSIGLTNNEYAAKKITNDKYALFGRDYIFNFYMFRALHPVLGFYTRPSNVYSYFATMLFNTLTDTEYTGLNLTNEEYEELNKSNQEYLVYRPDISIG